VVEEEADEIAFWMELIVEGNLLSRKQVVALLDEAKELARVMAQSRITARNGLENDSRRVKTKMASNRQSAIGNRQ
jgi:hypothetical protein